MNILFVDLIYLGVTLFVKLKCNTFQVLHVSSVTRLCDTFV